MHTANAPCTASLAANGVPAVVREAIEMAEAERLRRMVAGDLDGIAELCHPRLEYSHSTGRRDTLDSLLELIGSGAVLYSGIEHGFGRMECLGRTVRASGRMRIDLVKAGKPRELHTLTTTLWVEHEGGYRLLAFHATSAPVAWIRKTGCAGPASVVLVDDFQGGAPIESVVGGISL